MGIQAKIASLAGDTWRSWSMLAIWPYPAVVMGLPHSKFNFRDYRAFTARLQPGDMILTKSEPYFLSNRGIACTAFKHLGVYTGAVGGTFDKEHRTIVRPYSLGTHYPHCGRVGTNKFERSVTHAISDGVVCQDVGDLLFHSDWAVVVRPWADPKQQQIIVREALEQVGLGYNFEFKKPKHGLKKFYCTELGVYCCQKAAITMPEKIKLNTNWKGVLLPLKKWKSDVTIADAFLKEFPSIVASVSCNDPKFPKASKWYEEIRIKLLHAADANS